MNKLKVAIALLITLNLSCLINCQGSSTLNPVIKDESEGRSIYSAGLSREKRLLDPRYGNQNVPQTYYTYVGRTNAANHRPNRYNRREDAVDVQPVYQPSQQQYEPTADVEAEPYYNEQQYNDTDDYYYDEEPVGPFFHDVDGTSWIQIVTMGVWALGWVILSMQYLLGLVQPPNIQNTLTLFPLKRESVRNLDESSRNNQESFFASVLKSIDPIDLTFGVMKINENHCRQRAVCQLRKTVGAMPMIREFVDSYLPTFPEMEKYRTALNAGDAFEDCGRLFHQCKNDPLGSLPNYLRL